MGEFWIAFGLGTIFGAFIIVPAIGLAIRLWDAIHEGRNEWGEG